MTTGMISGPSARKNIGSGTAPHVRFDAPPRAALRLVGWCKPCRVSNHLVVSSRKLPDLWDLVVMLVEVAIRDALQLLNMRPLIFDWWDLVALRPIHIARATCTLDTLNATCESENALNWAAPVVPECFTFAMR
jgi:hypothetical protein